MSNELRVAISGKSGCGNSTVSRLVAERLDLRLINYTFRNIAADMGITFEEVCRRAEEDYSFDRELDRKQVEMAMEGSCVLGSRLAVWMLKEADMKVYLFASPPIRAERIRKREGGRFEEVFREMEERDARDSKRYKKIYGIDNDSYDFVDLIVDTDSLSPEEIAERIVEAVDTLER
jgi:cytidylate kinase